MRVKIDSSWRSSASSPAVTSQTNRQSSQGIAVKNNDELISESKEEEVDKEKAENEDDDELIQNARAVVEKCRAAFLDFKAKCSCKLEKGNIKSEGKLILTCESGVSAHGKVLQVDQGSNTIPETIIQANGTPKSVLKPGGNMIGWDIFLQNKRNVACVAPVEFFVNAPLANIWKQIAVTGLVIELPNPFMRTKTGETYWLASVAYFAGYKALVKFEDLNTDSGRGQHIAWISFCSAIPKYLGWCADYKKELNAGQIVSGKLGTEVFLAEFVKFYANPTPTISKDHAEKIVKEITSIVPFNLNEVVETIDPSHPYRCRLGRIMDIICDQVFVEYMRNDNDDKNGVWCNLKSDKIHPVGWSNTVGVTLLGTESKDAQDVISTSILPPEHFPQYPADIVIRQGMRLECRHPSFPNKIIGAIVKTVLKFGYLIIETRDNAKETRVKSIVHVTSPLIYQMDWAKNHAITVETEFCPKRVPFIHEPLNLNQLPKRNQHQFRVGLKLEAIQHHNPTYCVPATIVRTAGHMLCIKYDHFDEKFDMNSVWEDAEVGSIYPLGYAEMVGLKFEGQAM